MNCDRIAQIYRWLEYAAFGKALERCRFHFLAEVSSARRALILGDGDGRFLARFHAVSQASIDCVDSSAKMLDLARRRAGSDRVTYHRDDARMVPLKPSSYDLVATHFFLDCFDADGLERLIDRVQEAVEPGALWLISEFREPRWARPLVATMYLFFGLAAHLSNRSLVDHRPMLERRGFRLLAAKPSLGGLLVSELWSARQS